MDSEYTLVNSAGKLVAMLTTKALDDGGPSLRMYDCDGVERVVLEVDGSDVRLCFLRQDGSPAIGMAMSNEVGGIRVYNQDGSVRADIPNDEGR